MATSSSQTSWPKICGFARCANLFNRWTCREVFAKEKAYWQFEDAMRQLDVDWFAPGRGSVKRWSAAAPCTLRS